jgi:hypothetical protein
MTSKNFDTLSRFVTLLKTKRDRQKTVASQVLLYTCLTCLSLREKIKRKVGGESDAGICGGKGANTACCVARVVVSP